MTDLKKLAKDPIKLAEKIIRLMDDDKEFNKAMQVALFNHMV